METGNEMNSSRVSGKSKVIIFMVIIALISCVMLFYQRSLAWLSALIISGIIGLLLSRKTKREEDDY